MDWQKTLNLVAIGVVIWLLLIEWDKWDSENKQQIAASEVYVPELQASDLPVPQADDLGSELPVVVQDLPIEVTPVINNRLVVVNTDFLRVTIDTLGGDIVEAQLLQHFTAMPDEIGRAHV